MTATLAESAMQERAHRLIHRGLIVLARDMAANGTPPEDIADTFIAAGLMRHERHHGTTFVAMCDVTASGPTTSNAFARWLLLATLRMGKVAEPVAAIDAARMQ